ncbi:MAG: tyrosine-type recombinase/integrase [Cellulomonas sp.]|uniref:tyrosine-type recombinase/integrase n=1 Tax=Cellulomonas sp. TaxID=40001 RepID=UPI0019ED3082|nr:tyrosine-type recombinase/integrase [Cellulomonas sp.]
MGDAWRGTGRLFTREDGSDLRPDVVGKLFTRLSKEAFLPPMRFHDLRHLSASAMIAAGVALEIVSKLLGHSSIGVTSGIYSHLLRPAGVDAAARTTPSGPRIEPPTVVPPLTGARVLLRRHLRRARHHVRDRRRRSTGRSTGHTSRQDAPG